MKARAPLLVLLLITIVTIMFPTRQAHAVCVGCCNCETVRNYIVTEITKHETWLKDTFWSDYLEPALSYMANQINLALTDQTTKIGTFLEGQDNIEKRRLLQEMTAETSKSYLPSEQLCRFGSLGQSLASSEEKARAIRLSLINRSQNRQLGQPNSTAEQGSNRDLISRAGQQITTFCDKTNNGGKNASLCQNTDDKYLNADIDYSKTFDSKPTLDIDFTETKSTPTGDEKSITALADNLFASDLFDRPNASALGGSGNIEDSRVAVMDMRALIAKRSVAENSFNTLVGMKARGSGMDSSGGALGATSYIGKVLKELGLDETSVNAYLGKAPSYDAQMEVLTKKIYQSPNFYVNLMDNPANVSRQYAAMQSFGLMQQRDIFDSILRSEMLLSLIVELEVSKYQDEAQAMMDRTKQ